MSNKKIFICQNERVSDDIKTVYFSTTEPAFSDIGDEWINYDSRNKMRTYKKTEKGWVEKMDENKEVKSLSMNLKTDSSVVSLVFDGKEGSIVKHEAGSIDVKWNLDKEQLMLELESIVESI